MWSTFFVTDEEGHMVNPAAPGAMAAGPAGGPAQGAGGLANLMSGRSTFGGNKRRRTTSTGNSMSEAQEGKVGPWDPINSILLPSGIQLTDTSALLRVIVFSGV